MASGHLGLLGELPACAPLPWKKLEFATGTIHE